MSKLLMLKGLPASGKSTFAKDLVSKGWKRVNKDDLRAMIDCSKWSKSNEKYIVRIEQDIVREYLIDHDVVVDDTNFMHEEAWRDIADECFADFDIKFFDTPVMECIERDAKRGDKSVGAKVIMNMYNQFVKPKRVREKNARKAFIFDIDGTLAKMDGRSPFDWSRVDEDLVNDDVRRIFQELNEKYLMIVLSGRDGSCRDKTEKWLRDNSIYFDVLFMREAGDMRKDSIVKMELYDKNIKDNYDVVAVFDDRNQVVDMWRSLGITCCQVDYGFF